MRICLMCECHGGQDCPTRVRVCPLNRSRDTGFHFPREQKKTLKASNLFDELRVEVKCICNVKVKGCYESSPSHTTGYLQTRSKIIHTVRGPWKQTPCGDVARRYHGYQ